tara:strand:- start:2044 stop:2274 length:231 start_codon:yes stop_codon:yes gene_type:complete
LGLQAQAKHAAAAPHNPATVYFVKENDLGVAGLRAASSCGDDILARTCRVAMMNEKTQMNEWLRFRRLWSQRHRGD